MTRPILQLWAVEHRECLYNLSVDYKHTRLHLNYSRSYYLNSGRVIIINQTTMSKSHRHSSNSYLASFTRRSLSTQSKVTRRLAICIRPRVLGAPNIAWRSRRSKTLPQDLHSCCSCSTTSRSRCTGTKHAPKTARHYTSCSVSLPTSRLKSPFLVTRSITSSNCSPSKTATTGG